MRHLVFHDDDKHLEQADQQERESGQPKRAVAHQEAQSEDHQSLYRPGDREEIPLHFVIQQQGDEKRPEERKQDAGVGIEEREPAGGLTRSESRKRVAPGQAARGGDVQDGDHRNGGRNPFGQPVEAPRQVEVGGPAAPERQGCRQVALKPEIAVLPRDAEDEPAQGKSGPAEHGFSPPQLEPVPVASP